MAQTGFKIGVVFPQTEIGTDPAVIRDLVQTIEGLGFAHLNAYDHIVGADRTHRPDFKLPFDHTSIYQEPLMLFSYLASMTRTLEFSASVVNLAQRQTAVFAKQAANLDIYCGGRLRLGIGVGNNPVEYQALGIEYETRGRRLDEQIELLRRYWTQPSFSFQGAFHTVDEAGINPLPLQRPIPLWIGGNTPVALRRAARTGDGWMPTLPGSAARERIEALREELAANGRGAEAVPVEGHVLLGSPLGGPVRGVAEAVADVAAWREAGAAGVFISTMGRGTEGADAHAALFREIAEAVGLRGPA